MNHHLANCAQSPVHPSLILFMQPSQSSLKSVQQYRCKLTSQPATLFPYTQRPLGPILPPSRRLFTYHILKSLMSETNSHLNGIERSQELDSGPVCTSFSPRSNMFWKKGHLLHTFCLLSLLAATWQNRRSDGCMPQRELEFLMSCFSILSLSVLPSVSEPSMILLCSTHHVLFFTCFNIALLWLYCFSWEDSISFYFLLWKPEAIFPSTAVSTVY